MRADRRKGSCATPLRVQQLRLRVLGVLGVGAISSVARAPSVVMGMDIVQIGIRLQIVVVQSTAAPV